MLAPVGTHQIEVGQTWALQITAVGGVAPYQWRVAKGPALAIAAQGAGVCLLTWTPTLLDLAPTQPGQARAPGLAQPLIVELADREGTTVRALGTLRAMPALVGP